MTKRWPAALAVAALAILAAEGAARIIFDFPLYGADGEVGYWPLPDQRGTFLFTNDWVFNADSLGVAEEFHASDKLDVLLVGDSIVYGGNELAQADKLGPVIAQRTGWQVWPAAAGSWGLQNELAFLRRKPHLVRDADIVVVIVNSGDFTVPSEWRSEYSHPRTYPRLFLPYLFNRYVLPQPESPPAPYPVPRRNVLRDWAEFVRQTNKPVIAIGYSDQTQTRAKCNWVPRSFLQVARWYCYDGMAVAGADAFRDGIHPSAAGNMPLAEHIIAMVRQSGAARAGT